MAREISREREGLRGERVATQARREKGSAGAMLACLSHASRWTPVDVSHPVGADALQCLAAKLAAEGAATPPDLSGFTAGEAREMFPCLREWSECFTKALIVHARKLAHEKAKRPRDDDAAELLSQVARATPPNPPGQVTARQLHAAARARRRRQQWSRKRPSARRQHRAYGRSAGQARH